MLRVVGNNLIVGYLGDENTHTYHAAKLLYDGATFVGFSTARKSAFCVNCGEIDFAVAPLENSVMGTVTETLDAVLDYNLYCVAELALPIHQSLVGLADARLSEITTIFSHPQALSQCRQFLESNLPQARLEAVHYTSQGLEKITNKTVAAIARVGCGDKVILRENIEDYSSNETRFISLAKSPRYVGGKASVVFGAPNRYGALVKALQVFDELRLNMTKIESRPNKARLGEYIFFVDFTFDGAKASLDEVLGKLREKTNYLRFLGQY